MKPLFVAVGIALALYTCLAAVRGEVIAKYGAGMRRVRRDESVGDFRAVIAIYAALALALVFWF
ncbi:hypothetical protein E2F46_12635 [Luteimonas aestuarii]|uniref:Uncharacterized protein n=1 Tax=Luteimonas aestuarii TaxID=453837 RepID=A0A4R5TM75_9GAMM|nr:hypothetical protein [Luteimonas aestuarii]TDK22992.1 hypothetical protein E2F46_12635 [Luteimonas aestuarii]